MTHAHSLNKIILLYDVSEFLLCARPSNLYRAVALVVPCWTQLSEQQLGDILKEIKRSMHQDSRDGR